VDKRDIEMLYNQHSFAVFRRCQQIVRCEALAQELTQDAFLRLLEKGEGFAGRSSMSTYLYAVATNLCLNRLRNDRRRGAAWLEDVLRQAASDGPRTLPDDALARRQVVEALLNETDAQTALIATSHFIDELPQGQIAELVGLSRVTVNQRLARFREHARVALGVCA
jgi:RNA polymerase sigma-70 factor (ECF subfamily)